MESIGELEPFAFVTNINTLEKIHLGEMTDMGREYWNDKTPLDFMNPEKMSQNINIFKFIFSYFILDQLKKLNRERNMPELFMVDTLFL
ncbi:MAG: hypothetical protein KZY58_00285 [Clostridiaceae bacterium]|nr:hypothetical protein [Clostridiaceae bacterium]MBW4858508.1 hypothetical protein [Clostridiaceae bacterium]